MNVLPRTHVARIEFCELHADVWAGDPAALGLTETQVTALAELAAAAREAHMAADAAREAAKAATVRVNAALAAMTRQASTMIRAVKAHAAAQDRPADVYAAAQVPLPAAPSPSAPPSKPMDVSASLMPDGSVKLAWRAENAAARSGAFFVVMRKLAGQSTYTSIGAAPGSSTRAGRSAFIDHDLPAHLAAAGVSYIVRGQRGTTLGAASTAIDVRFGVGGEAAPESAATLKRAA